MSTDGGRGSFLLLLCTGRHHNHRNPKNFGGVDFQHLPRFFPYRRLPDCFITPVYINASCASCIFSYVSVNTWYARVCIIRWGESRECPLCGASRSFIITRNFSSSVICAQRQFSDPIAFVYRLQTMGIGGAVFGECIVNAFLSPSILGDRSSLLRTRDQTGLLPCTYSPAFGV